MILDSGKANVKVKDYQNLEGFDCNKFSGEFQVLKLQL